MGLIQQIQSGSLFIRGTANLTNTPSSGSISEFGATYILLGISADAPCRVRLYANSASIARDLSRPSSSFNYSTSVALNLDAGLTPGTQSLTFVPPVIATTNNAGLTWYNIESATPVNVAINYYPIEEYKLGSSSRTWINIPNDVGVNLGASQTSSGNFSGSATEPVPKSFLMLNATSTSQSMRLRLYSLPIEQISNAEKSRAYGVQPSTSSSLITDMLFESASYVYNVSPVLQAYNLEGYLSASNRVGYILQNTSGVTQNFLLAAIKIYPLED